MKISQASGRRGLRAANVVQMMIRLQEDVLDDKRHVDVERANGIDGIDSPRERLFDLSKAYPRENMHALSMFLERYGMRGKRLETIIDLHETTEYEVKGREGMSKG